MRGLIVAIALCTVGRLQAVAHGEPATLAALGPAADARKAIAIGPAGQVYEPDGKGTWVRRRPGGTASQITGATAVGATVIAAAKNAPPFKLKAGTWTAVFLSPKAKAIVGTGSRVLAAVGKSVFALDTTAAQATKLPDAPANVSAIAASKARAVIVTTKGMLELVGKGGGWKLIKKAPKTVRSLVSERWAVVNKGALDLKTLKTIAWPAGLRIDEATTVGELLLVVASKGKQRELLTIIAGKVVRESIPIDSASPVVAVVADANKRVVVAARDGTLAVRTGGTWAAGGTWTAGALRDELPAPRPGSPPAISAPR